MLMGQGCGLLDPHSDLCDDLLAQLSPRLISDPDFRSQHHLLSSLAATTTSCPFNVLRIPGEPYTVAQNVLEAFRRTWPESLRVAPRFSNIVLASLLLLIEQDLTLIEMPRLLTEPGYRQALLRRSHNIEVIRFFQERYERWGRERATMVESVLNKVGAFVINPRLKIILGSQENGLPFREIMDGRKVLLCDLGRVDAETRRLLGSLIVTGLEQAAFTRKDTPMVQRQPFTFLIDEFQDYCANAGSAQTLARILAECRKFQTASGAGPPDDEPDRQRAFSRARWRMPRSRRFSESVGRPPMLWWRSCSSPSWPRSSTRCRMTCKRSAAIPPFSRWASSGKSTPSRRND